MFLPSGNPFLPGVLSLSLDIGFTRTQTP